MNADTQWRELFAKKPQVIKPGLDRMRKALAHIEKRNPRRAYPPLILVGGTNGKGSTSGYLYQLLARAGLKVGLFSSPHLCDFAERIQCSHLRLCHEDLIKSFEELKGILGADLYAELSFFELNTLLARQVFLDQDLDLWIFEVGMGGRWDATNAFDPCLSVITSVALDHTEFLGPTTSAIAREKSGIMRRNSPVIWGGQIESDPFAHQEILMQAREKGARLLCGGKDFRWIADQNEGGSQEVERDSLPSLGSFWCQGGRRVVPVPSSLQGLPPFLKLNFLKAFSAYLEIYDLGLVSCDPETVLMGYTEVQRPPSLWARFQEIDISGFKSSYGLGRVIFDVAHNPHGTQALVQGLKEWCAQRPEKVQFDGLISVLGDKDVNEMLDILEPVFSSLILFRSQSERAFHQGQIAQRHEHLPFANDFQQACAMRSQTIDCHQSSNRVTIIAGSVYALGEVLSELGMKPLAGGLGEMA